MNKWIILIICLLFVGGALFMIFRRNNVKIIKNPKELELTYEINAGIPFRWEYEIEDPSVVEFVKKYVIRDDNKGAIVGASVYTNYVFRGLKEGKTEIIFKFYNFADDYVSGTKKHYVMVDENLNIFEYDMEE